MTRPTLDFIDTDLDRIADAKGLVVTFLPGEGKMDQAARRVNRLTKGALARLQESGKFQKLKEGEAISMAFPVGMAAEAVLVIRL